MDLKALEQTDRHDTAQIERSMQNIEKLVAICEADALKGKIDALRLVLRLQELWLKMLRLRRQIERDMEKRAEAIGPQAKLQRPEPSATEAVSPPAEARPGSAGTQNPAGTQVPASKQGPAGKHGPTGNQNPTGREPQRASSPSPPATNPKSPAAPQPPGSAAKSPPTSMAPA